MRIVRHGRFVLFLIILLLVSCKQRTTAEFISVKAPIVALTHGRVSDGTGSPGREDQANIIASGRITAIGPTSDVSVPPTATSLDLNGHTAIPGLVGMHDHLFYATDSGDRYVNAPESFAPLYLAAGVTTIRTAGALKFSSDAEVKRSVDNGELPGPKIHLTSPYINHNPGEILSSERITELVNAWADHGVASYKIYENITRAELSAVVDAAHKRGLKVTGHTCAVGFSEAAQAGIDNLEHGLVVDTEFFSRKKAGECPR